MRSVILAAACLGAAAALQLDVDAGPGSLAKARGVVRHELARRRSATTPDCSAGGDIVVRLGSGRHYPPTGGLELTEADAGTPGCFKVVWRGAADGSTVVDGGLNLTATWSLVDAAKSIWSTPAPASLLAPKVLPVRTLFVGGVRYNRTRDDPSTFALLGSQNSMITNEGYLITSAAPQSWTDPTTVEIVKQGAFTQDRCPIASVVALPAAAEPAATAAAASCPFGQKLEGRSPGSTIAGITNVSTYEACQAACCSREHATPPCAGIMYKPPPTSLCYLVDRDVLPNFGPGTGFVSNMNPRPVTYRTAVNISQACISTARSYKYGQAGYPDYLENTGNLSAPGHFYLDRKKGVILATLLPEHLPTAGTLPVTAVVGLQETVVHVHDTHDVEWHNVSFEHSAWTQANADGYVERFSNLYIALGPGERGYRDPAAAVVVERSRRVAFDGCSWKRLGAWALRIENASQDIGVRHCEFTDLSGGAVMLGSPDDNVAPPATQLARIDVADNTMTRLSVEYVEQNIYNIQCSEIFTLRNEKLHTET